MTVKTRITLFVVAAGFLASLLFSVVVFFELIEQPFRVLDSVLKEEASATTQMILRNQRRSKSAPVDSRPHALYPYWIEIYDQSAGQILYRSSLAESVKLTRLNPGSVSNVSVQIPEPASPGTKDSRPAAFRARAFLLQLEGRTYRVQIARPMEKLEEEIRELALGIISGLILSTLALIALSRFVAGKILQPITTMKNLAREISENNLERRIPTGAGRDEFSELAKTINRMLDRLQTSFARQRNLLFDTSHELKTPLSTMRLAIDEIYANSVSNQPALGNAELQRLSAQVLRMDRLVKGLLNLSSLEISAAVQLQEVHLTQLLSKLASDYRFLAEARSIRLDIRLPGQLDLKGDAEKLRRAFSNMLDNAIKYNEDGGRIEVVGAQSSDEVTITVGNTGPGIAASEISKVFDQFYRVEKSRSLQYGGSGLGLTIVKKIVELHDGSVTLESEEGAWTRITVRLPIKSGSS